MALINETTLQRRLAALERFMIAVGGVAGGKIEAVRGIPTTPGNEGDIAFDSLTNQMYVYLSGVWTASGNYTWVKYADQVNNIGANGRVSESSDVIGGMYDNIQVDTKYIGQALNQASNVESSSVLDYTWTLHTASITAGMIDTTAKPEAIDVYSISPAQELYQTNSASGVKTRLNLSWETGSSLDYEPTVSTIVQFKPQKKFVCSNSAYAIEGDCISNGGTWSGTGTTENDYETISETTNQFTILPDIPEGYVDIRLYAVSRLGVRSDATTLENIQITGVTGNPQHPTGLALSSSEGQTLLTWNKSTELDVNSGGSVQIRIHPQTTSNSQWNSAQVLVESLQGTTTSKTVPLMVGTYMVKFIDSGGRESLTAATAINSFAPTNFNFVSEVDENASGFLGVGSGSSVNCSVVDTDLKIDSGETSMTYEFPDTIDLNEPKNVRVVPDFNAVVGELSNEICQVTSICELNKFCNPSLDATISFEVQTSDDNITFSGWEKLIAGNYSCRSFKFRVKAEIGGDNLTVIFSQLSVSLDTVDLIKTGSVTQAMFNTAINASQHVTVTFPNNGFYSGVSQTNVPRIGTQVFDANEGDTVVITNRSSTSFDISVYNNGSRVARDVDWQAIGQ